MLENNSIELSSCNQTLGELQSIYRVKINVWYFFPHLILFFVSLIGLGLFLSSGDGFKKYLSILACTVLSLPFLWTVWFTLRSVRDELKVYEKGFTYKSLKRVQSCLWSEIKDGGFVQDFDGRNLMTSVVKKNNAKINFAYKMQGLDEINRRYDDEIFRKIEKENEQNPELTKNQPAANAVCSLGELENIYRVKHGFWTIALYSFLFFPWILFTAGMFATKSFILLIFVIPLSVLFFGMLSSSFKERHDELNIYQNGFTYQSRKGLQSCLWNEIADCQYEKWTKEIIDIKKEAGDWISFSSAIQGLDELKLKWESKQNKKLK